MLFYFVSFTSQFTGVDDVDTLPMLIDFLNVFTLNDLLLQHWALSFLIFCLALLLRRRRWMLVPAKRFSKFFVTGLIEKDVRRVARPERQCALGGVMVAKGRAQAVMRAHLGGRIIKLFFWSVNREANARRRRHFTPVFAYARAQGARPRLHGMLLPVVIPQERNAIHAVRKRPDDLP